MPDESALYGLRVLAVDDNHINLLVVGKALEQLGILAETAGDGQQALDRLRAGPTDFDAVLMDIQMPLMDGLTATREIRRDPALRHLSVIALSAGVLAEEREAALAAGVNDFLGKPLKLENLKAVLYRFRSQSSGAAGQGQ
ncbi:MAG: response regulator [Methylococcus sp.]|nr:MAG: response regulator [Methylococcus sp.]